MQKGRINLIINRGQKFSSRNGVYIKTAEAMTIANKALKEGRAKLIVDTPNTLAYEINEN
jgi:hypothetical protein